MGDMADLALDSFTCQECGAFITNDDWPGAVGMSDGHPRFCRDCGGGPEDNGATKKRKRRRKRKGKRAGNAAGGA